MPSPQASDRPPASLPDSEALLLRFDQAWQQGTPPSIEQFLGFVPPSAGRRQFLEELVMIDLEYRWRLGELGIVAPSGLIRERPRLEDYVAHYAELGGLAQLTLELIGTEYRVRRRWGDRPGAAEYAARFPRHGAKLPDLLRQIDTDLAAEYSAKTAASQAEERRVVRKESPLAAAGITSVAALVEALRRVQLLSAVQLEELTQSRANDPRALARDLLKRGWLTPYQVNQIFLGRAAELVLGPYLILERLGEGGTGQVFKARQVKWNRLVALKVLRKELLADPEVVSRFNREIRVLRQLEHPNIVTALDAGPMGATHLLAMEYVEGTDLSRLVKQKGPLPVAQACDYIRQAALGLQHAFERGLVHRDIKPHNLLLATSGRSGTGVIKIVDLGLARLQLPMDSETTAKLDADVAGSLTPVGAVMMGTADYMAPEQALDFHRADIRADIYSLGATFYFLLTGQPPFSGGSLTQKLLKHQQADPPRVHETRADVGAELSALVARMLSKRPEDRPGSPAEVASALDQAGMGQARPGARDRRRLLRRGLAVGAGLLGTAGIGYWIFGPDTPETILVTRHQAPVRFVVIAPDDDLVASGSEDFQVQVASRSTGARHAAFDLKAMLRNVTNLACSPEGKVVAASSRSEGLVKLWNLATKADLYTFGGHSVFGAPDMIALAPEYKTLAVTGGPRGRSLKLNQVASQRYYTYAPESGSERIVALAFSADGNLLASASQDKTLKLHQVSDVNVVLPMKEAAAQPVRSLAFSPDGKLLASCGGDGTAILWDTATGSVRRTFAGPDRGILHAVAFAPSGQWLATAGGDAKIRLWDPATGQQRAAWDRPDGAVLALAFSARGSLLATGTELGTVHVRETPS